MMDLTPLDPYERQLLTVFDSYDHENRGSLDRDGLTQLCQTLQLEEQAADLIRCLLKDESSRRRATFTEFKDALLALLGQMQQQQQQNCDNNDDNNDGDDLKKMKKQSNVADSSPDREVSPKFVYGSKKYGRRTRPKNNNIDGAAQSPTAAVAVQRSNSQIDVVSKKRKTNYKLKRCTSLPGQYFDGGGGDCNATPPPPVELICTEDMLREAWKKLGVGTDGYLNQTELVLVCDAIGLHQLAKGVIRQLSTRSTNSFNETLDFDYRISFRELLEALQQDDAWFDVLNSTPLTTPVNDINSDSSVAVVVEESCLSTTTASEIFPDSQTFQYVTLGPDGNGVINIETIIEMWETVGITSPKELLIELGFNAEQINLVDLAQVLENEIKGLHDNNESRGVVAVGETTTSPLIALLNANLILYQLEIRCLKNIIDQMHAEREKLKCDVSEANNRATLLAQEVDDNHTKMERNTLNQVKLLEQRHNEILKDCTQQYSNDKEQLVKLNQSLENKIAMLELETNKLKNDLVIAQKYSSSIEKENQLLSSQINELKQVQNVLTEQISNLENEKQKFNELENHKIEPLLGKLNELQIENAQLRDRNDEMVTEIENLTQQVSTMRCKVMNLAAPSPTSPSLTTTSYHQQHRTLNDSMDDNIPFICEGVGLVGAKRRSDYSPTKDNHLFGLADGSPRLGKLRKFHKNKDTAAATTTTATVNNLDVGPYASNESGFDGEIDDSSLANSTHNDCEEITRLQSKVAFLEQLLTQHAIPIPANLDFESSINVTKLNRRIIVLESILTDVHNIMKTIIAKNGLNCDNLNNISDKLEKLLFNHNDAVAGTATAEIKTNLIDASMETEDDVSNKLFEDQIKQYEQANKELTVKCAELENCVDLLRNEYERCEDYWQLKLDEERQMFEQEQQQNTEKLTDLIHKMAEYEEQFPNNPDCRDNNDDGNRRLATIEETFNLEKQFTDLEQEFDEYKVYSEQEIYKKDEEIYVLKQKLDELVLGANEEKLQRNEIGVQVNEDRSKMDNLSLCFVETTNLYSADAMPVQWIKQETVTANAIDHNNFVWNKDGTSCTSSTTTTSTSEDIVDNNTYNIKSKKELSDCDEKNCSSIVLPSTSSNSGTSTLEKNSTASTTTTPCRPKRTRKHERNNSLLYKKNNNNSQDIKKAAEDAAETQWKKYHSNDEQQQQQQVVAVPITTIHNLNGRLHHLEQRCRQLQIVLKQQHFYTEQSLTQCWQQHHSEKSELQCILRNNREKLDHQVRICNDQLERLARSDMLVKELYVENSYLIAKVQRLEHQCHMLAQCSSTNCSSV